MLQKGKATCLEENVYVKFQAIITLHDIFHLPLVPTEYTQALPSSRTDSISADKAVLPKLGSSRLSTNSNSTSKQPTNDLQNLAEALTRKAAMSEPNEKQPAEVLPWTGNATGHIAAMVSTIEARNMSRSSTMKDYSRKITAADATGARFLPSADSSDVAKSQLHGGSAGAHEASLRATYTDQNPLFEQDSTLSGATSIMRLSSAAYSARLTSDSDEAGLPERGQSGGP